MNTDLLFDFTVDKAAKTVRIEREFDAELSLVWDAFTKAELLDQWVAPAPYKARTKYMNFEVGPPQVFWDRWTGLANDTNEYSNNLLPAYRTEFWIPTSHSQAAMQLLENFYKNDFYKNANNQNRNFANGSYVVEILGAKQTPIWLSPSFGEDCLRINFYSLHQNDEDVYAYFGQFWKLFAESKIPFRLHWGYYLPQAGSSAPDQEISAGFPKFNAFAELRKTLDPENIFLTAYWKQHLNL